MNEKEDVKSEYSRMLHPHGAFIVVELCGDIEPNFEPFVTYEEAVAYLEAREIGYKAWIVGPEWTEDRS